MVQKPVGRVVPAACLWQHSHCLSHSVTTINSGNSLGSGHTLVPSLNFMPCFCNDLWKALRISPSWRTYIHTSIQPDRQTHTVRQVLQAQGGGITACMVMQLCEQLTHVLWLLMPLQPAPNYIFNLWTACASTICMEQHLWIEGVVPCRCSISVPSTDETTTTTVAALFLAQVCPA